MTNATTVPGGLEAREPAGSAAGASANGSTERTPDQIEADIEATRRRLAGTVDAIAERVKPANVAKRGVDSAKLQVVDEDGNLRTQRVAMIAVAVAAVAGLVIWRRTR